MKKVTIEIEEGNMLYAVASEVGEELDRAQRPRPSARRAGLYCHRLKEFTNCWVLHNAACAGVLQHECKTDWRLKGSQQSPSDSLSNLC